MNQTVRTIGIAVDLAGFFLLMIGVSIQGYQKKPIYRKLGGRIILVFWIVGGICIIGGLVTIFLSF